MECEQLLQSSKQLLVLLQLMVSLSRMMTALPARSSLCQRHLCPCLFSARAQKLSSIVGLSIFSAGLACCLLTDLSMAVEQTLGFTCFKHEQQCFLLYVQMFTRTNNVSFYSDARHVDWVKSYLNIWSELQAYIKEHHTTGLTWSKTVSTLHLLMKNHEMVITSTSRPGREVMLNEPN